jgi:disease resistance protein RPM1
MQEVTASLETLCDVAALTKLRLFSISGVTSEHSVKLCSAIINMRDLGNLSITTSMKMKHCHWKNSIYPKFFTNLN